MLDVKPLISEIVDFEDFDKVYGSLGKVASIRRYNREPGKVRTVQITSTAA